MLPQPTLEFDEQYAAATSAVALAMLPARTCIELTGSDRAALLHNLCTNDILSLVPGGGCELFLTSVKGKVLGYCVAQCRPDSLLLETVPGQADRLLSHLDRYIIREDVQLTDRSDPWRQLLVVGPAAAETLGRKLSCGLPTERLGHIEFQHQDTMLVVMRSDFYAPDEFSINGARAEIESLAEQLAAEQPVCGERAIETLRVETGTPAYECDITDDNLPQEVGRDDRAISFTKGCYLGQETVARIDALGHVNRRLCQIRFERPDLPPPGTELLSGEKSVGSVTSSVDSPKYAAPLALAYVRRGYNDPGQQLDSPMGNAEIV